MFGTKEQILAIMQEKKNVTVDFIDKVVKFRTELSPQTHAVHAHGLTFFNHDSWMQVCVAKVKLNLILFWQEGLRELGIKLHRPIVSFYVRPTYLEEGAISWKGLDERRLNEYIDKHADFDPSTKRKVAEIAKEINDDFVPGSITKQVMAEQKETPTPPVESAPKTPPVEEQPQEKKKYKSKYNRYDRPAPKAKKLPVVELKMPEI